MPKVISVIGNRPQFVKQAMLDRARKRHPDSNLDWVVVNSGQHYDVSMSQVFFDDLQMMQPKYNLDLRAQSINSQVADLITELEPILTHEEPDAVLLFGATSATLGGALTATQMGIPVIHVEGGERLYRRIGVPEEVNRVVTDHLSSLVLASSRKAMSFLEREGFAPGRSTFIGDIMLDLYESQKEFALAKQGHLLNSLDLTPDNYVLATLHRAENADDHEFVGGFLQTLDESSTRVVMPVHPRLKKTLAALAWRPKESLTLIDPRGYHDFLALLLAAELIVSDSGGVTREAIFASKPCIVPLARSWWSESVEIGLTLEVGQDLGALALALEQFRPNVSSASLVNQEFGQGDAGRRILDEVQAFVASAPNNYELWHRLGCDSLELQRSERQSFSYDTYRRILSTLISANYQFQPFKNFDEISGAQCLLRHDVDIDLEPAVVMARIEAEMGVKATYFVMLRSENYNVLTPHVLDCIHEIIELGHFLGLHFDAAAYCGLESVEDYSVKVQGEISTLSEWTGRAVSAVSFHRPNSTILAGDSKLSAGLPHAYDKGLRQTAEYISDSTGEWRFGSPLDSQAFRARQPIHVLIHPIWWDALPKSRLETLLSIVDRKHKRLESSLARNCAPFRVGYLRGNENEPNWNPEGGS